MLNKWINYNFPAFLEKSYIQLLLKNNTFHSPSLCALCSKEWKFDSILIPVLSVHRCPSFSNKLASISGIHGKQGSRKEGKHRTCGQPPWHLSLSQPHSLGCLFPTAAAFPNPVPLDYKRIRASTRHVPHQQQWEEVETNFVPFLVVYKKHKACQGPGPLECTLLPEQ